MRFFKFQDVIERAVVRGRSGCFQLDFVGPEECGECGRVCREAAKLSKVFEETIYNILPPPAVEVARVITVVKLLSTNCI